MDKKNRFYPSVIFRLLQTSLQKLRCVQCSLFLCFSNQSATNSTSDREIVSILVRRPVYSVQPTHPATKFLKVKECLYMPYKQSFFVVQQTNNLNGSLFLKADGSGQRMSDWLYLEMTDVKQTRTLFVNGTDLADSFKKGSFKQSCSHMTTYKAVGSNAKNYP